MKRTWQKLVAYAGGDAAPEERLEGSLAAAVAAALAGASMLRVHDVKEASRAIKIADAIRFGAPDASLVRSQG